MKREGDRRWVTIQDFALFIILIAGYVATIFVPRCWDRRLIEFASKRWLSLRAERVQHLASIIEATLTPIGSDRSLQVAEELVHASPADARQRRPDLGALDLLPDHELGHRRVRDHRLGLVPAVHARDLAVEPLTHICAPTSARAGVWG